MSSMDLPCRVPSPHDRPKRLKKQQESIDSHYLQKACRRYPLVSFRCHTIQEYNMVIRSKIPKPLNWAHDPNFRGNSPALTH
jgi:hypothetical protein